MDPQTQHQLLPSKHVGSFLLLMFIATFRPTSIWPNFPISLEPIAVLAIGLLLFYKIYATIGFKDFWTKYKVELLLLSAYFSVCFISLYLNRYRYADTHEIIRYGITFIVITMSFPSAIFLFLLPQNKTGLSLSQFDFSKKLLFIFLLFIPFFAIWQKIDPISSEYLTYYFMGADTALYRIYHIVSIFRVSTDLGAVLAISSIFYFYILLKNIKTSRFINFMYFSLFLLSIAAGGMNGKRIFY